MDEALTLEKVIVEVRPDDIARVVSVAVVRPVTELVEDEVLVGTTIVMTVLI